VVLLVSTYIIPLGSMALCYTRMSLRLRSGAIIGEETPALMKSRKTKQKVRRTWGAALLARVFSIVYSFVAAQQLLAV
jgi:hypothetical protein